MLINASNPLITKSSPCREINQLSHQVTSQSSNCSTANRITGSYTFRTLVVQGLNIFI